MKCEFISKSLKETETFAKTIAKKLSKGDVIAFFGDLGTGKTTITKIIAKELGITEEITSPTFTLLEEYQGKLPFYHFDLYRIEYDDEFDLLCFEDYWEGDGVSIIEWAERAVDRLPASTIKLSLEYIDENTRRFEIEYPDN